MLARVIPCQGPQQRTARFCAQPEGTGQFCAALRCSTTHLDDQTSRLAPSPAQKLASSRSRRDRNRP
ncbi:MAG: hypothetical protein E6Q69_03295 [Aquipseudomonas alcaligenes]|uniref:Uncharacterized protein n=1 Tax=Aquipseudomonas alcaligenes TaxID=43263 RepID=A0A5C7WBA6_AQUAC|nr:MAG: hypothetical protein E6Q69_03295 [Pseudomonas alcaligenes]